MLVSASHGVYGAETYPHHPGDLNYRRYFLTLLSVTPRKLCHARLTVAVTGSNFQAGASVDFGARVAIQNVTFVSTSQLDVGIKVHRRAASGDRTVTVTNPDGESGALNGCFSVN